MEKKRYEEIAKVAHDLYEKSGRVHGRDEQNWFEAERIVIAQYEKGFKKEKPIDNQRQRRRRGNEKESVM